MKTYLYFLNAILSLLITSTLATTPTRTPTQINTDFIQKSCNTTLYPRLCYAYLSVHASRIGTSPRLLAQAAMAVTLSATRATSTKLINYSNTMSLKARERAAINDCIEEVNDSIYELEKSMREMGRVGRSGCGFVVCMNNIETWVSAALTDDDTCMDGFYGQSMDGKVKVFVREHVLKIEHLTSIALNFVTRYASS